MAGKASSAYFSANDETEVKTAVVVKVKKPSVNSAREVRNAILREHFGYTASDIEQLDAKFPGKFFIVASGDTSGKEMSSEQVRLWKPDAGGTISVPLNDYWLTNLWAFRKQRITSVLEQAAGAISDSRIRTEVLGYLEKIFSLSGEERLNAVRDLIIRPH